ncbi:phosphatidylinositol/phosphatidylcholine transfer protein SFH3-like [Hibiscus syriacus]|uniref:phosphatidylinositol/phosphatidylcholine transfer protein SFH3-like n=1 Tax=Hibiscus syriacus TaxID=106335 RepID=UPI0019231198|nr:phosphatidylinositol/phosphatidylcholine transfer protein SFH3-like [Hibiscus syriacus]
MEYFHLHEQRVQNGEAKCTRRNTSGVEDKACLQTSDSFNAEKSVTGTAERLAENAPLYHVAESLIDKNCLDSLAHDNVIPVLGKNMDPLWSKLKAEESFAISNGNGKVNKRMSNQVFGGIMAFITGTITMIRMTRNM